MSPEQAQGRSAEAGLPADVYALGATLYDLLCERPPRLARNARALVLKVATGAPFEPPSAQGSGAPVDEELDRIVVRALQTEEVDRYPDAGALAADLALWLDGARKRERAMALVQEAEALLVQAETIDQQASDFEVEAERMLRGVDRTAPANHKAAAWALQDEARQGHRDATDARSRGVQSLRSALTHAPDLPEAHARLAEAFHARHVILEAEGRAEDARALEADLSAHDRAQAYAAYLAGTGSLTLHTDPPGAEVRLYSLEKRQRRLEPVFDRELGTTPLEGVPLEQGSYLLTLNLEGRHEVRYPVVIGRQEHWDGVPAGASDPDPIHLPLLGSLAEDDCYVPAGWFWAGDDEFDATRPLTRMWSEGFVMKRHPVTLGQWVDYLNALLEAGEVEAALEAQPRLSDSDDEYLGRDEQGRFTGVRTDRSGPGWDEVPRSLLSPIIFVSFHQAVAYARWQAVSKGLPWRLPADTEWQKAGRGAMTLRYPWGDHFEPTWCLNSEVSPDIMPVAVTEFPEDVSIYGVRGLGGNVADWATMDASRQAACVMGGSAGAGGLGCRLSHRMATPAEYRAVRFGFRLIRSFGETVPGS